MPTQLGAARCTVWANLAENVDERLSLSTGVAETVTAGEAFPLTSLSGSVCPCIVLEGHEQTMVEVSTLAPTEVTDFVRMCTTIARTLDFCTIMRRAYRACKTSAM